MNNLMKVFSLTAILLVASGCSILQAKPAIGLPSSQNSTLAQRTINVTGTGVATATPDIAYLNIGVHTESYEAGTAVNQNNNLTRSVKEAIMEYGIEDKDIQTSNFSIYLQSPYSGIAGELSKIIVDNTVLVTVRDLKDLSKMLGEAIRSGANNIYGITFDIVDKQTLQDEARSKAMQNAEKQAQQLAQLSGGKPGKIIAVTVVTNNFNNPYYGEGLGGGGGMANTSNVPVSAGNMTITVDINVVYELLDH